MTVRPFVPADYDGVLRLHNRLGAESDVRESTLALLKDSATEPISAFHAYVCQQGHEIVGFAILLASPLTEDRREASRIELSIRADADDENHSKLLTAVHAVAPPDAVIHAETTEHHHALEALGYRVVKVNAHLGLDLDTWDAPLLDLPYAFRPYTALENDTAMLADLHALITRVLADVPRAVPRRSWTFEEFLAHRRTNTQLLPALSIVASDSDRLVAFTELKRTSEDGTLLSSLTGVHPAYRGRQLSLAVKRQALAAAQQAGFRRVVTQNATTNEAMIRANERLGFAETHRTYECVLTPELRHG